MFLSTTPDAKFPCPWALWQESRVDSLRRVSSPSFFPPSLTFQRRRGEAKRGPSPGSTSGCVSAPPGGLPTLLEETGAHMAGWAWVTSLAAPVPPGLCSPSGGRVPTSPPSVPAAPPRVGVGPGLTPDSGQPGARGSLPASASAHLARLVELLLQPRHRHAAFRRGGSRPNRRDRASDKLPGAADTPRASAGPLGAASTALSPAPRPPQRRLSPSRARAARILHGNRTLPVPACARPGPRLRTRAPCRPEDARALRLPCGGRLRQRGDRSEPRESVEAAATPGVAEVVLTFKGKALKSFRRGWEAEGLQISRYLFANLG